MSIYDINSFPGSDNLESKLPGVSFVGTDRLTEPTRAGIEEERVVMTRGMKAAATRKANRERKAQEALATKQEEQLKEGVEGEIPGAVYYDVPPTSGESDPSGLTPNQAGAKLDHGKIDMAMILASFPRALFAVGSVGMFGAEKYSFEGWMEVEQGVHRYTSAGIRHFLKQFIEGPIDGDSKAYHLAQESWNALAKLELYLREKGETGEFEVKS